jgi:hypothetical protein
MLNSEIFKIMKSQWNILITRSWTGWDAEQWDFQNNEKTMEYSDHWIVDWMACRTVGFSKEWKDNGTLRLLDRGLDGMQNSGIFERMKRQWNILITGLWLDVGIAVMLTSCWQSQVMSTDRSGDITGKVVYVIVTLETVIIIRKISSACTKGCTRPNRFGWGQAINIILRWS